ncbi:MAG: hypothetical protein L0Y54_19730 [Sporichthyaceae bacterium]|nr:hypothetical protein [Sporichthyaceae bacterium]
MAHLENQSPARLITALVVGLAVAQAIIVFAFAWPAARISPRDIPLVIAGSAGVVAAGQLEDSEINGERPFDITVVPDEAAARAAVEDRKAYAAIIAEPTGARAMVASAASPAVAQLVTQLLQQASGGQVQITELAPLPEDDPRGGGLAASLLPMVLISVVAGALLSVLVRSVSARLAGWLAVSVVGGLVGAAIIQYVLGSLEGPYLLNAAAIALTIGAVVATVAGLGALLGPLGIGLGALTMLLAGIPLSGLSSAPELLPQPWGDVGQALPPGAGGTLLRSTAFFDAAGSTKSLIVLAIWTLAGLALMALASRTRGRGEEQAAPEPEPVSEPPPA